MKLKIHSYIIRLQPVNVWMYVYILVQTFQNSFNNTYKHIHIYKEIDTIKEQINQSNNVRKIATKV
jgi:hypothetical protein